VTQAERGSERRAPGPRALRSWGETSFITFAGEAHARYQTKHESLANDGPAEICVGTEVTLMPRVPATAVSV
jgi:hypothetical protein